MDTYMYCINVEITGEEVNDRIETIDKAKLRMYVHTYIYVQMYMCILHLLIM